MTEPLRFTYSGHSANWDTYTSSDPKNWYATVIWMDLRFVAEPGSTKRRAIRVKPAEYTVTVHRAGPKRWEEVTRFTYRPSRDPKDMHLPNQTVTRLIRKHLPKE